MPSRPYIRPCFYAVGYAALIFIPLRDPGLFASSLVQVAVCGCLLVLLILLMAHRNEMLQLLEAVFCAWAGFFLCLLPFAHNAGEHTTSIPVPTEPFHASLFQRPPPYFA
jgi:hypothetical protein